MKKIAIDIRLLGKKRTGDEAVFFHLTRELLALDREHEYVLLTDEKNTTVLATLHVKLGIVGNSRVEIVSLTGRNRFMWNLFTIPWYLLRHRIDIFHTQYIAPIFVPRRTKLVLHIHDVSFAAHPEWIGKKDLFFLSHLIPGSLARADAIVAPSRFTREEIIRFYKIPPEKVFVVPNSFDEDWLTPSSQEEKKKIQEKLGIQTPYLITIGTMQPRKNIPFLIETFRRVRDLHPELSLVLVGNPRAMNVDPAVQKISERNEPGIIFPGYLSLVQLRTLVSGSSGLVFPSLYEGFGIPLLEGMAVGVPIAASSIPPFHEVGGEGILYFSPTSLVEAEKALYTLYIDTAATGLAKKKAEDRLKLFSWKRSAEILLQTYNRILT